MNDTAQDKPSEKRHNRTGRSPMLSMIFKNRQQISFAYAYLLEANYTEHEKDEWIMLNFGFATVQLGGRGIEGIYRDIVLHHADEVNEVDLADVSPNREGILKIIVERPKSETD